MLTCADLEAAAVQEGGHALRLPDLSGNALAQDQGVHGQQHLPEALQEDEPVLPANR